MTSIGPITGDSVPNLRNVLGLNSDFRAAALSLPGIEALWLQREKSGTIARDETGTYPGVYIASPTLGAAGLLTSDPGTAVTYNGSTQYMQTLAIVPTADVFTVFGWFVHSNAASYRAVLGNGNNSIELQVTNANKLALVKTGVQQLCDSGSAISQATHFAIATKNGTAIHLYLDGVDVTANVVNATCAPAAAHFAIGMSGSGSDFYANTVGVAGVYLRDLTPAECAYLWHVGSGV